MTYNENAIAKVTAAAEQAFAQVKDREDIKASAAATRARLFEWLVTVDERVKAPESVINQAYVDAFKKGSAIEGSEDEKVKAGLVAVFQAAFTVGGMLVSRSSPNRLWEQTGLMVDAKAVFAKVGNHPYQPIGFEDGNMYLAIESSSKTLWTRQFGLSLTLPINPPFDVVQVNDRDDPEFANRKLSEDEVKVLTEIQEWFSTDFQKYQNGDAEVRKQIEADMVDTIKLARVKYGPLDDKMTAVTDQHPDLGKNFEKTDIMQVAKACYEWVSMRLDEDKVRQTIVKTELHVPAPDAAKADLLVKVSQKLNDALPNNDSPIDPDTLNSVLSEIYTVYPPIRMAVDALGTTDLLEVALAVKKMLDEQKG